MSKILTFVFILPVGLYFAYELVMFVIKLNAMIPTV